MPFPIDSIKISPWQLECSFLSVLFDYIVISFINFLTTWSIFFFEKVIVTQLVKKFPTFYGTWRSITVFTGAFPWSLSWARWIQSSQSQLISLFSVNLPNSDIPCSKSHIHFPFHRSLQRIHLSLRPCLTFCKMLLFYGEKLLVPPSTQPLKLEKHPLLALCNCLFNIFTATLHIWRSSPPSAT